MRWKRILKSSRFRAADVENSIPAYAAAGRAHGYRIAGLENEPTSRELEDLIVGLAGRSASYEQMRDWLKDHLARQPAA